MIKSKLYTYLRQYLGEYLYGLQEDQLEVALLSGAINFTNANFRPDKVNDLFAGLGLPFTLKAGLIGSLQVKYHYMSMLSNPVEITVDNLILVLGPVLCQQNDPDPLYMDSSSADEDIPPDKIFLRRFAKDRRKTESDSSESDDGDRGSDDGEDKFATQRDKNLARLRSGNHRLATPMRHPKSAQSPESPGEKKEGFIARYFTKVLKNLTLKVSNLHIRYEDDIYPFNNPFSFGICLQNLGVKTVPQEWVFAGPESDEVTKKTSRRGAIAKEINVTNFSVYLTSMSSMLIPTSLWEATQSSPIGIFDALPAFEVKELTLQESEIIFEGGSNCIISPVTTNFTITLDTEAPKVKACVPLLKPVEIRMTAAMVECSRSFFEYFTNVQLWPYLKRYRPFERVLIMPRSMEDPEFVVEKRKKLVRKWFIYACRFLQAKRKLLELVQKKRKQDAKEKRIKRKKERYVRVVEEPKSEKEEDDTFEQDQAPINTDIPASPLLMSRAVKNTLSFLVAKPRRIPGMATSNLSAAVNEYNKTIMSSPPKPTKPPEVKPKPATLVKRDLHFKPPLDSCEIDIRGAAIVLILSNDTVNLKISVEKISSYSKVENDVLKERISIGYASVAIGTRDEENVVMKLGKKEVVKEEIIRGGLFSRGQRRAVIVENAEQAGSVTATYVPGAFRGPGEEHPTTRMYDIHGVTTSMSLTYSHIHLIHLVDLLYAYQRESHHIDESTMREIERKRTSQLTFRDKFVKIERKMKHENTLMSFATEELAKKLLLLKGKFQKIVKETDEFVDPINFSLRVDFGGLDLALNERDVVTSFCDLHFPSGKFEFEKVETRLKALLWGFGFTSKSSFGGITQFFQVKRR